MKIARVFPRKTSFSPTDEDCYFSTPPMWTSQGNPLPYYDEVHISCTFTWDIDKAYKLAKAWEGKGKVVKVGGPALGSPSEEFIPGKYLKRGVTITSRGCPNNCSFCLVPKREGKLREIEIKPGNIIQDNNFLACSKQHQEKVFAMLRKQRQIEFKGGLEASRITPEIADRLRSLRIKSLWVACDRKNSIPGFKKAVDILHRAGFTQNHIYCYVLIGDNMAENEERLRIVYESGALPFAQLFQPDDHYINYSREWKQFARTWSRPAAYKALMRSESA